MTITTFKDHQSMGRVIEQLEGKGVIKKETGKKVTKN